MNTKSFIKYTFVGALALSFAACTGDFEETNTNPYEATEEDLQKDNLTVGSFFSQMELRMIPFTAGGQQDDSYGSTGSYQHFQGLCSDWYSGYVAPTGTWASGNHNGNYFFTGDWGNSMYKQNYTQVMPAWATVCTNAEKSNTPQVAALATVVKVYAMHRVTDQYGPIPYVNYVAGSISNVFDSQEAVYKKMFQELDDAIDVLTPFASSGGKILPTFDYIYKGDAAKWAKFANTLRLRLALRVVYADAALAQQEAEKSLASVVGFLEEAADRAVMTNDNVTLMHPIYEQAYSWGEERMSASMDSYMNGYSDPRRPMFFTPASDNKYHGVRLGINFNGNNKAYTGDAISNFNLTSTSPIIYMSAAESHFLRAEAALRGWNAGGSAKSFYEKGIKVSMEEWGVTSGVDTYISGTSAPAAFVDKTGKGGNAAQPSQITVAYDESAAFETNLERIITQKWLANFLISPEGWAEFRRTGYPKLFPTTRNSDSSINTEQQIRRMPYPESLYNNNREAVEAGVQLLGGPDKGGTKLWWDKK